MAMVARILLLVGVALGADQVFEDSPILTALWQASNDANTDAFINQLIQNRESALHRSADGRGPMFWAYEFKNVETLALLMHLGVTTGPLCPKHATLHCHCVPPTRTLAPSRTDRRRGARDLASTDQEDLEGKTPPTFFPDGDEARAEFEADAKAKVEDLAALLAEREEEFYSYQNAAPAAEDDYDDEDAPSESAASKKTVDEIDYADDEDEEEGKDEM